MQLSERQLDGISVIYLSGNLTVTENPGALKTMVTAIVHRGERSIVLSVANLGRMDSSCLGEIVASYTTAARHGGMLKLARVGPHLQRLLEITKLNSIFECYASETEAASSFRPEAVRPPDGTVQGPRVVT